MTDQRTPTSLKVDAIPVEIVKDHTIVATAVDGRYPRAPYRARCTCGAHFGSKAAGAGYVKHLERLTLAAASLTSDEIAAELKSNPGTSVPERESTVRP